MINMTPIKTETRASRAPGDPFRESVLAEDDEIDAASFVAKLRTWLVLLRLSSGPGFAGRGRIPAGAGARPRGGDAVHGGEDVL